MEVQAAGRTPWRRTVALQAALCLALYGAFSIGEPQLRPWDARGDEEEEALGRGGRSGGVSFLSVAGGSRPPAQQARLLRQFLLCFISNQVTAQFLYAWLRPGCLGMERIAKVYEVKLVLDVAQLGEGDELWQNGSLYFQVLKIPWYSTASHGQIIGNFVKKVKMPHDQILEIISVDTGPLEEPLHDGKVSAFSREQIAWLEQSLALTSSNWKIVVGYDPLIVCSEAHTTETAKFHGPIQRIFEKSAVNAYLSTGGSCGYFRRDNSMLYIQNPSPGGQANLDGFILHRVSPLEMESLFINLDGDVVQRYVVQQHGVGAI